MFFYRIEDKNGKGLYRNKAKMEADNLTRPHGTIAANLCSCCWGHNPPDVDFPEHFDIMQKRTNKAYHFGFKNIHQLYRWFDTVEAISFINKTGFKIAKYKIEKEYIEVSEKQIIFKKGHETFVGHVDFQIEKLPRKMDYSGLKPDEIQLVYKLGL